MTEIILKGRLDGIQRNRLKSLFDMMYSPKECTSSKHLGHKGQFAKVIISGVD